MLLKLLAQVYPLDHRTRLSITHKIFIRWRVPLLVMKICTVAGLREVVTTRLFMISIAVTGPLPTSTRPHLKIMCNRPDYHSFKSSFYCLGAFMKRKGALALSVERH